MAVAIPCYNEAAAIGAVVDEWRAALPAAEVVVLDNNSTDGSAAIAAEHGARVVAVPEQGKGFVVRRIFAELGDRDAVVMIDGDGTYPASAVGPLLEGVLERGAMMAVGLRRPVEAPGAMPAVRRVGNLLIGTAFRVLIGRGTGDLLSGYRVFSRRFMNEVRLRSEGFEIETELAGAAAGRGLLVVEEPVPYRPRIAGTESKLRAFRDGLRILRTILRLGLRLRPWRLLLIGAACFGVAAAAAGWPWLWWVGLALFVAAIWASAIVGVRREAIRGAAR